MNDTLAGQIGEIKFDFSDYGQLPVKNDIIVLSKAQPPEQCEIIYKQWETLNYLLKNLQTLNEYLQTNKGETLNAWLAQTKSGISKSVVAKLGNHTNKTGGITAYFLNLQKIYNEEEAKYDNYEKKASVPDYFQGDAMNMQLRRLEKRKNRTASIKIQFRDLKKDDKGYLYVNLDEPEIIKTEEAAPEQKKTYADDSDTEIPAKPAVNIVKKEKSNVGIWVAVSVIAIVLIFAGFKFLGNKK